MKLYNWQQKNWPHFTYKLTAVGDELLLLAEKAGEVAGMIGALPPDARMEAIIDMMAAEAVKTSEIEGEYLSREDVKSSIRNNLGLHPVREKVHDRRAEGIGRMMADVRNTWQEPLTAEKLFDWHRMLFHGQKGVSAGAWRTHAEPMQVVSGPLGKQKVHYEAPPSAQVPGEMEQFITWFNATAPGGAEEIKKPAVRSAIAHLYFESIHPFEDGNGRIGRAIAEKALSQGMGRPVVMSLSATIEKKKKDYYEALEKAQRATDITAWIRYFVHTVLTAQREAEAQIGFTIRKAQFFDRYSNRLSERQLKVIRRMLDEGPEGFEGGMNASKYGSLTKVSKATATRDLQQLAEMGVLAVTGGGRSTRYTVNW